MKINEILHCNEPGGFSWDEIYNNHSEAKQIGLKNDSIMNIKSSDQFQGFKGIYGKYNSYYLVNIKLKKIVIVSIMEPIKLNNKSMLKAKSIEGLKTHYTENHLAMKLYQLIRHTENMPIISDDEQTTQGKFLWQNLSASFNVSVINKNTGKFVSNMPKDAYINWDEFNPTTVIDNNILMLETIKNWDKLLIPGFAVYEQIGN